MYIALWEQEVWVDNPYYSGCNSSIEPVKIQEYRQHFEFFENSEKLANWLSHSPKIRVRYFEVGQEVFPKLVVSAKVEF